MKNSAQHEYAAFFRVFDDNLISIEGPGLFSFVVMLELTRTSSENTEESKISEVLKKLITLSEVSAIVSLKDGYEFRTVILVSSKDPSKAAEAANTVCKISETISDGIVRCRMCRSREALKIIPRILGHQTFLQQLGSAVKNVLLNKHSGEWMADMHPIPWEPAFGIASIEEESYIAKALSRGGICIGYLAQREDMPICIEPNSLFRHVMIVGSTGGGKSTTASIIAASAANEGFNVIVFDWHGEYLSLIGGRVRNVEVVNPVEKSTDLLAIEDLLVNEPLAFIEILESSLELTPAQAHILEEAVEILRERRKWSGSVFDVLVDLIESSPVSARWMIESKESLIRKMKPLTSRYTRIRLDPSGAVNSRKGQVTIIDLSSIHNLRARRVVANLMIRTAVFKAQNDMIDKPVLIVVDEAHNVFEKDSPLSKLIGEVRKWSIGFVIVTQTPSLIPSVVLKNTNTKIVHVLKSQKDLSAVIPFIGFSGKLVRTITALKPGEAILIAPEIPVPVFVKIEWFEDFKPRSA